MCLFSKSQYRQSGTESDRTILENGCLILQNFQNSPDEAPILLPLIMREIVYRLLMGEQGVRPRHLTTLGEGSAPIAHELRNELMEGTITE